MRIDRLKYVGRRYQDVEIIAYSEQRDNFTASCKCGNIFKVSLSRLRNRPMYCCPECSKAQYRPSINETMPIQREYTDEELQMIKDFKESENKTNFIDSLFNKEMLK